MIANIIFGLVLVALGISVCYYSYRLVEMMGRIKLAEDYLGSTRTGYILVGFVMMVVGFGFVIGMRSL